MPHYRHIVQFKLDSSLSPEEIETVYRAFKAKIEALPAHIPTIQRIEVSLNLNPKESWHVCLFSEFASLEEINDYSIHPLHLEAVKEIKPYLAERSCTDCLSAL
ncbi:MAG: Dabb family protein [Alloprevotella sp.]|nr:Dabb family protein [Alloprevotella sp.]